MKTLCKISLVGIVGKDPDVRTTSSGLTIASFSLATEHHKKKDSSDESKTTQWHQCVSFGKLADIVQLYVVKGSKLHIEGTIEYQQYEKDGVTKNVTKVIIQDMIMLCSSERPQAALVVDVAQTAQLDDGIPF
jgi:single-strand DNA-binding protein